MLQSDTNRQGTELLICGGAIPDSEAGIEAIREVLDSLWKGEMTEADLYQDKLTKRAALIYDAPCMRRIADRFFADIRVQAVRWIAAEMIPADHVPEPAASEVIYTDEFSLNATTPFQHAPNGTQSRTHGRRSRLSAGNVSAIESHVQGCV